MSQVDLMPGRLSDILKQKNEVDAKFQARENHDTTFRNKKI